MMIHPRDLFLLPKDFKPYCTQLLFYLLFADHKEVWASQEKLAAAIGSSTRTVIRVVNKLENLAILSVKRFQGGDRVNHYKLNQDALARLLSQYAGGNGIGAEISPEDFSGISSEDVVLSCPSEPPQPHPEVHIDPAVTPDSSSLQQLPQDAQLGIVGDHDDTFDGPAIDPATKDNDPESHFDDSRLDALVEQIERSPKPDTRLFNWLKAEKLLTYWPPTHSYRVEKRLLRERIKTWDELNLILTAPVRLEYQWLVTEFLQCCRENGYQAKDTSQVFSLEINMFLDEMLKPQGRVLWTTESIKTHMKTIIQEWHKLKTWKQWRLPVEQPSEPTLEFLINNKALWQAAREKWIDEEEVKIMSLFESLEGNADDKSSTAAE